MQIVLKHAPDFEPATIEMRPSRQGKYLGLTLVIQARSREQLIALESRVAELEARVARPHA